MNPARPLAALALGTAAALAAATATLPARAEDSAPLGVTARTGQTTFRVWAPNATSVAVIGDFNGWKPMQADQLTRDPATGIWSVDLRRSRPKGAYAFLINGDLVRRDPYARAITPDERHSLFHDPDAFTWTGDTPPRYPLDDLVIYEMHIGAFFDPRPRDGEPGTFADAARRLDYLVELGVNTLCLLPVHEFSGRHSWGYNPSDLFAVEQAYGGPDALKAFVRAAHARGLAVHLDIVHNHYGPENLPLLRFDGTGNDRNGGIYFYDGDGIGMTPWGPRVKFDDPTVRRFIRDNAMLWLEEYRVDGFRWDSTINIRAYNFGADPLPAGAAMLDDINREIRARHPGVWSIAEDSLNIGNFHASWDYDFHHRVMPALAARTDAERDLRPLLAALGAGGGMPRVIYVDNHDEAGKINGMQRIASDVAPHDPGGDLARRLSGLGALFTFTAPGIPLLFMGNEFQEPGVFHDDLPLDWGNTTRHAGTLALHRDLIALRRNRGGDTTALRGRGIRFPATDHDAKTFTYWRHDDRAPDDAVVIAVNLSGIPRETIIPFPAPGPWRLLLNTDHPDYGGESRAPAPRPFTLDATTPKAKTTLAPYSARLFTLVDRPAASASAPTTASPAPAADPAALSMYAALHLIQPATPDAPRRSLALTANYQWEGVFPFDGETPVFRLAANDDGVIHWGGEWEGVTIGTPHRGRVKRLGPPLTAAEPWHGIYRVRFNEETLALEVDRIGDLPAEPAPADTTTAPATPEPAPDGYRTWTDLNGRTLHARLLHATDTMVTLERPDGRRLQLPRTRLSPPDQTHLPPP